MLDETGFCFLFAPAYHPGMKHAALVRRQLEVRTIMNLLGPCINPARPPVQLLGVADPKMLRRIAQTLDAMGVEEALVVHGSGLDEVALHGETRALRLSNGEIEELEIAPEDAGLERAPLKTVTGGDAAENAQRLRALLDGRGARPEEDIVVLNTAALLQTAGLASSLMEGAAQAARRPPVGQRRPGARPLRRGEPWLRAFSAGSPPPSAPNCASAMPASRSTRCAAGRSRPRAASPPRSASPARASSSRSRRRRRPGERSGRGPTRRRWRAAMPGSPMRSACCATAPHFGGSLDDLAAARREFDGPILAKDFFIDPRQVAEARIAGADAVLVMLSLLDDAAARA